MIYCYLIVGFAFFFYLNYDFRIKMYNKMVLCDRKEIKSSKFADKRYY
jgi:hypothetical protein